MGTHFSTLLFTPPLKPSYSATSIPLKFVDGVPCLWYPMIKSHAIILYLHCNFTDLGMQRNLCYQMSRQVGCNVIAIEYPGFGICPGQPNVQSCVHSALMVYQWACSNFDMVYVMGRSIGTGVAGEVLVEIKQQNLKQPDGVILHSAFVSLAECWSAYIGHTLANHWLRTQMNTEYNLTHTQQKRLLILHGARDHLFPVWHAHQLYNNVVCADKSLIVHPFDSHSRITWEDIFANLRTWIK